MTQHIRTFTNNRHWDIFHTPRSIALALLGEVGELAELFQWSDDEGFVHDVLSEEMLDKAGQEIADISIYLLPLCDVCDIHLGEIMMKLLE
jgi:NTP pyrophosphatase (non-canonical NTP hydrolase)